MKKNNIFLAEAAAVIFMTASLCGCADVDGEKSPVSEQTADSTGESSNVSISNGKISVSFEETSTAPANCKIYKQKRKKFSEEQLLSFFSGSPEKVDSNSKNDIKYETDTEMGFISEGEYFMYSTLAGSKYQAICDSSFLEYNNVDGYTNGTLDFATRDEVLNKVKAILRDKFGIAEKDCFSDKFYAVKKENVDFYKESINEESNKPVTSENEREMAKLKEQAENLKKIPSEDYYYISMGFKIDDIPLYPGWGFQYGTADSDMIMGYKAAVVYTKNGIEFITIYNLNETNLSSAEDVNIISSDEAWALIRQKFDGIIMDGEIEIYDMQFVYLPIPQNNLDDYFTNFEARPFYAFYWKQTKNYSGEIITSNFISYFDAVTGTEFATEPIYN